MFKNYIQIALRNLLRNKAFSFINIFGLAVGLACCMLITLYVYHEYSYDTYHKNSERIFQLAAANTNNGETMNAAAFSPGIAPAFQSEFPEIEKIARLMSLFQDDRTLFQYREPGGNIKAFYETKGYMADPDFFSILTYDFKEGNGASAFQNPNSVVISEEIATKLFGSESALGKVVKISSSTNNDFDFTVSGVFRPNATPSHIDARFLMSFKGGDIEKWMANTTSLLNNNMFHVYLLLKPGSSVAALEQKFRTFEDKHFRETLKARGGDKKLFLVPVEDIHLRSDIEHNVTPAGSRMYVRILSAIAILTLIIACINFMNLSTARSTKRGIEVGIRKVLGAEKSSLVRQFLGESLLMAFIAFLFAIALAELLLPLFKEFSGRDITLSISNHAPLFGVFVLLTIITGLLAGSYPAFYLSSFKPASVLKGRFSNSFAAVSLRKGLVIFQFVISVALIISSVIIANQMNYLRSKDLGFIKEKQVVIPLRSTASKNNFESLKTKLAANSQVQSVGAAMYYPGIYNPSDWLMYKEGNSMADARSVYINHVDNSFLKTLGIQPKAGRIFSHEFPADTNYRIVLNQKGVEEMGFASPEQAVGSWVAFEPRGEQIRFEIVGVVNDFHFKDLRIPIESYGFLLMNQPNFNYLIAHVADGDMASTLQSIEQSWRTLNPNEPFEYSFLDQDFQKNYEAEYRLAKMIGYFTSVAILISCLGLFGLATFSAEQRTKEIGVRKVLGASIASLMMLLTVDFLKLVIVGVMLASPLAWYIMNEWLQTFAYRVEITPFVFIGTGILALFIAIVTVSFQTFKVSVSDPVRSLRYE
ncbi:MAG TPA: ABC transporter permease [Patescibacteria group bacterium]|nr:ABC transporter permease [Patescibacteria group bacterium]